MANPEPTPTEPARSTSRKAWRYMLIVLIVLVCLPNVLGWGARWHWTLELFTHFRVQWLCLQSLVLLLVLVLRHWLLALVPAAFVGINLAGVVPFYLPASQPPVEGPQIRALLANVHSANSEHDRLIALVRREQPDLFVVLEVNEEWIEALRELETDYPFGIRRPRSDNFGIAVYSRLPIVRSAAQEVADSRVPTLFVRIAAPGGPLTVVATHTLPPVRSGYARRRNRHLRGLAKLIARTKEPVLLLGDLNCTSWSPRFRNLVARSRKLRDSRRGFGLQPTWPQANPLLWIPIDHALVSEELSVRDRRTGPNIGSDHRPVILDIALSPANRKPTRAATPEPERRPEPPESRTQDPQAAQTSGRNPPLRR